MPQEKPKIAYFSMEFALRSDIPNYAGGLGVLASDILKSCADLGEPVVGVTLMYHQSENPKEAFIPDKAFRKRPEVVYLHIEDRNVAVGCWEYSIKGAEGAIPLYFLDTNLPENKPWDRDITKNIYALDRYTRLCQEGVLGFAGVRMLRALGHDSIDTFHMNEGHAAFLTLELLKERNYVDAEVRKSCVFTTHTPVPAGHDQFEYPMAQNVLGGKMPWHIQKLAGDKMLNMTRLAISLSRKVNAVAKSHQVVCSQMFPGVPFECVTNGVHLETWVSDPFQKLYDKTLKGWRGDPSKLAKAPKTLSDEAVLEAHAQGKQALVDYINGRPEVLPIPKKGRINEDLFNPNTLTITFARRFASYKRALLLFSDVERLREIGFEKLQLIFAGPYHPDNTYASDVLGQLREFGKELRGQVRLAVIPDYDLDVAKFLVQGSDVWLNNPQPPMEASGTSGMKAAANGALNLSILDGWWPEGYALDPQSGWAFGETALSPGSHERDIDQLYERLEEVVDCFYEKPEEWVERMKHAITLGAQFNTHRCVEEYKEKMWKI
jgi:glycogen phosphorylase